MDIFKKYRASTQIFLFGVSVCLIMALRYAKIDFVSNSLWAEDGAIFYPQAFQLGIASLFKPYAGYLHLYPRAFAIIAMPVTTALIPFVFFAGWLTSICVLYWAMRKVMVDRNHAAIISFAAPLVALLQPHAGETFLSLTNAQWWLGCSLAIIASMPWAFGNRAIPIVAVLCLTGPFSILFFPVAAIQCVRHKRYALLATIAIGAAIQLGVLSVNPRGSQVLDTDLSHWLSCLITFATFGADTALAQSVSIVFWIGFMITMARPSKGSWGLIACGLMTFAAALYSLKGMPHLISPVGNGGRYFAIPYTLLTLAIFNNAKTLSLANIISLVSIALVFAMSFHTIEQPDTKFYSYSKFTKYETDMSIPIAPIIPNADGYKLIIGNPDLIAAQETIANQIGPGLNKVADGVCGGSRNVGVAVSLSIPVGSYVTLKWEDDRGLGFKSATRFYNAGEARIQMVFEKNKRPVDLYIETIGATSTRAEKAPIIACY